MENRIVMGEFITKGDANQKKDMNPIPYENFIGKVALNLPSLGYIAQIITSLEGKITAGAVIILAIGLQLTAFVVEKKKEGKKAKRI